MEDNELLELVRDLRSKVRNLEDHLIDLKKSNRYLFIPITIGFSIGSAIGELIVKYWL